SLAVPAGCTTALVGSSGAGKTTIASLFLRFWDPGAGAVRLSGRDLKDYRLDEVRGQIALVAQDTYPFNDTLRNNILIARPTARSRPSRARAPASSSPPRCPPCATARRSSSSTRGGWWRRASTRRWSPWAGCRGAWSRASSAPRRRSALPADEYCVSGSSFRL